jgi:two-component system OmpR family response regulator
MNVLLVEDDSELARQLRTELSADGHAVHVERGGPAALKAALRPIWDIVIMDVSLPGMSGFEIVEQMRSGAVETPVIFLTAKSDVADRVRGLSLGGDDYLSKPFSKDELKARLQALTRRFAKPKPATIAVPAGWTLNPPRREVNVDGEFVTLQPREWSLLGHSLRPGNQCRGCGCLPSPPQTGRHWQALAYRNAARTRLRLSSRCLSGRPPSGNSPQCSSR